MQNVLVRSDAAPTGDDPAMNRDSLVVEESFLALSDLIDSDVADDVCLRQMGNFWR